MKKDIEDINKNLDNIGKSIKKPAEIDNKKVVNKIKIVKKNTKIPMHGSFRG